MVGHRHTRTSVLRWMGHKGITWWIPIGQYEQIGVGCNRIVSYWLCKLFHVLHDDFGDNLTTNWNKKYFSPKVINLKQSFVKAVIMWLAPMYWTDCCLVFLYPKRKKKLYSQGSTVGAETRSICVICATPPAPLLKQQRRPTKDIGSLQVFCYQITVDTWPVKSQASGWIDFHFFLLQSFESTIRGSVFWITQFTISKHA